MDRLLYGRHDIGVLLLVAPLAWVLMAFLRYMP